MMIVRPRLILYANNLRAQEEFSDYVEEFEWEIASGCTYCTFVMRPSRRYTELDLAEWFKSMAGRQVRGHVDGAERWRGRVWSMQWINRGLVLYMDMARLANAVRVIYQQDEGDDLYTDWITDDVSIDLYGRHDQITTINSKSLTEAEGRAERILAEYAFPYKPYPGVIDDRTRTELVVTLAGARTQAEKIMLSPDDVTGEELPVWQEIERILDLVDDRSGYLRPLSIAETNTRTTVSGVASATSAMSRLDELVQVLDDDGLAYHARITEDGGFIYEQMPTEPAYYYYPTKGITRPGGDAPTWDARPGVLKMIDNYGTGALPRSLLGDVRLSYIERVVMREGSESCTFHPMETEVSELIAATDANKRWVEQSRRERERDDGGL